MADVYSKKLVLVDGVTPVLARITRGVEAANKAMRAMNVVLSKGVGAEAFEAADKAANATVSTVEELNRKLNNTKQSSDKVDSAIKGWKNSVGVVTGAIALLKKGFDLLMQGVAIADEFTLTSARLEMVAGGLEEAKILQQQIFESAERSRGSYEDMAASVARLGAMAGDTFSSTEEMVAFTEMLNKSFAVGGAGLQEQQSAMTQLTQAMAAGRLQGDEFGSIMENAPLVAEAIAEYMGVSKGELKELSSQGLITADIIKNAMFNSAGEINRSFESMPMTFGQIMQSIKNNALMSFQPVIERFSEFINSPGFKNFVASVNAGIAMIANAAMWLMDIIENNMPLIEGLLAGVAVVLGGQLVYSAGQAVVGFFNVAEGAKASAWQTTLAWIKSNWALLALAVVIMVMVAYWDQLGQAGQTACVIIAYGLLMIQLAMWGVSVPILVVITLVVGLAALFYFLGEHVAWILAGLVQIIVWFGVSAYNVGVGVVNFFLQAANWIGNAWSDMTWGLQMAWYYVKLFVLKVIAGLADGTQSVLNWVLGGISSIINAAVSGINWVIDALNSIPGVDISRVGEVDLRMTSNWSDSINDLMNDMEKPTRAEHTVAKQFEYKDAGAIADNASNATYDAIMSGNEVFTGFIDGLLGGNDDGLAKGGKSDDEDRLKKDGYFSASPTESIGAIEEALSGGGSLGSVGEVGKINEPVTLDEEDVKLMLDISKARTINRFSTLRPSLTAQFGDVRETADVTAIMDVLETMIQEAAATHMMVDA